MSKAQPGTALANIDDLFTDAVGEGLENIGANDIILPRLALLQGMSPLSSEEGYRQGDFVHTVTGHNFGKSLVFYPLLFWENRTHWVSPLPGSDIECQARDGAHGRKTDPAHNGGICDGCQFSKWSNTQPAQPPRCTLFKNVLLVPADNSTSPMVFSAKRTALKPLKAFTTAVSLMRRESASGQKQAIPLYACSWRLDSEKKTVDGNNFYIPKFTQLEIVSEPTLFMQLRTLHTEMKESQSRIVVPQDNDDPEGSVQDDAIPF